MTFKAKGLWFMEFNMGQNARGTGGGGGTGYNQRGNGGTMDEFDAYQRIRLQLDAVASEALSGTVWFEMNSRWGSGANGGALGADGTIVVVKNAYLDWTPPNTDLKIRMGLQALAMPSFTGAASVFDDDVAAITFNYKFNDNVSLTALWARPYNDNGADTTGATSFGQRGSNQYYLDNVDVGALLLPLTFDGVKVTPWVMLGAIGPNFASAAATRTLNANGTTTFTAANQFGGAPGNALNRVAEGMLPVGVARHKDGTRTGKIQHAYATAFWAGLTGEVTAFDPFRFAWDIKYGSSSWPDDGSLNRAGWLASLLFEYKLDWGIPGLYAWYGSGDDDDPSNGSERMAVFDYNGTNQFSDLAFNGAPSAVSVPREGVVSTNMAGTWGIGIRLKDVSFVEDLKHTLRVNYIGGTNNATFARRYIAGTSGGRGFWGVGGRSFNNTQNNYNNMYLTTKDSAVEFGLKTDYKVYENLNIYLDANYIVLSIDHDTWKKGGATTNGVTREVRDPWNVNVGFVYSF
jgi:outer membrane protein W